MPWATVARDWALGLSPLSHEDRDELLRVSIVRGISVSHSAHYRVVIGTDPEAIKGKIEPLKGRALMISRIHTMEPATSANVERFITSFQAAKSYYLAPGFVDPERGPLIGNPMVLKRRLYVREAWTIGRHDADVPAIHLNDDILKPKTKRNAPVNEVLRWLRCFDG